MAAMACLYANRQDFYRAMADALQEIVEIEVAEQVGITEAIKTWLP